VTHVFVGAHPDDIALSCGGLVASLRELGQAVSIVCVFSGTGNSTGEPVRTTLGFGNKGVWPLTEAFRRDNIAPDYEVTPSVVTGRPPWMADPERLDFTQQRANTQARQFWQRAAWTRSANVTNVATQDRPVADAVGGQATTEKVEWDDEASVRRASEERFAYLMEASVVFLDLPPAPARGYSGDEQLLGAVRDDDITPDDLLYREIVRLEPQMVYFPLAVGNHVDHQLCRDAGLGLLHEGRRWVMPGPDFLGRLSFYEDFPYAWWSEYNGPLANGRVDLDVPVDVGVEANYADITETIDRKIAGISLYPNEVQRLFASRGQLLDDVYGFGARTANAGQVSGYAERYWATTST
jgi:LmbE family N-acetylglucosaminyl deacetylase